MEAELTQLIAAPITAVAWNKDRTAVAISPGNEHILVYTRSADNKWILKHTLSEHDQRITGLDWTSGPEGERILSCSADRNAYVWSQEESSGLWKPSLVLLRFKRAATCAKWTTDGTKFAVGGVEGLVAIGHYDRANDWWVCKHLKKSVKGPVLSIAWHPTGAILALGTLEGQLMLASTYITEADSTKSMDVPWVDGAILKSFDSECISVEVGSWVHAVAFSPSGNAVAWSNHGGLISVYYPSSGFQSSVQCLSDGIQLPLQKLLFVSESVLMAAGSSGKPQILSGGDGKDWRVGQELANASSQKSQVSSAGIASRMATFQKMDQQGQSAENISSLKSKGVSLTHISAISSLESFEHGKQQVGRVATTGLDGRVVIWSIGKLASELEMGIAKI